MTNIRVALRVRPLSQREIEGNYPVVVAVENNSAFITDIRVPERPSADSRQRFRQFDFDNTFWFSNTGGGAASQENVYMEMGPHLEKAILAGYNACLLAYGQSGTGKTHTMLGSKDDPGIIPRLCHSLFEKLKVAYPPSGVSAGPSFRMEVSFLEIYREKVRDLLNPEKSLKLREHPQLGPHVQGLTRLEVTGEINLRDLLWEGERRRASGTTTSNRRSSRSHAIWTLYLTIHNSPTTSNQSVHNSHKSRGSRSSTSSGDNTSRLITNQVHLVDLAGSEKADCTTAKSLLAEGADINRSLVALGNVISALAEKAQYVPYRDSALTWLLKDSIGGNASTSIIITASPSSHCHAQTLNSLRFAQRARLVENTPKINLAPVSPVYGPYGYLSVMSAMELKKDISRLAKIIQTAQSNGGILRGLAPRAGWTRLIHAIEGISHAEKEQARLQRERACSEDTTASSAPGTSSSSTITATKSLNDVMVQADMEKRNPLRRHQSRHSESALLSSPTQSPTKIIGTEVFIPTSSSIKCLTWQQEESHPVPKPASSASSLSEAEEGSSTPTRSRCSSTSQIHHLKYFKVNYHTTHNVGHAGRICEKIHGSILDENYQNIVPVEVCHAVESGGPLVQGKIPTLVNPSPLPKRDTLSERVTLNVSDIVDKKVIQKKSVMVAGVGQEKVEYTLPVRAKEFATVTPCALSPFESSDENEFDEPEEHILSGEVYRAVHPDVSKSFVRTLHGPGDSTFEDTCYFTAGESVLSQQPSMLVSSPESSSYESINMPDTVRPVNLVREFSKTSEVEDHALDFEIDNEVFREDFEAPVANICMVAGHPMESAVPIEILVAEPSSFDNTTYFNPVNGVSDSKFRNYFAKELHQMERMGKQIKNLLQLTQRCNVLKPYLDELCNLQNSDHSKPDPKLDAHIESCSGWDVRVEMAKVNKEISSLNKVLRTGFGSGASTHNGMDPVKCAESAKGSSTSNDGGLTDSSVDVECASSSYAHTRHIPLLSGMSYAARKTQDRPLTLAPAKSSMSQPILSSSSNNGSATSTAPAEFQFTPNFYSSPIRKEEFTGFRNTTPMTFTPHPGPHHSMETFYRNPAVVSQPSTRLPYCPSNSNMSSMSISSNASTSVNYDTANSYPESGHGYPLNISLSEPKRVAGREDYGSKGAYLRSSESSTSFQSHHAHYRPPHSQQNSFNSEEIRSHRRVFEGSSSMGAGSTYSLLSKDTASSWMPNGALGRGLPSFQRIGAGEPADFGGYPYQSFHSRTNSGSLDLCSCGDSKCGTVPFPLSSLEKSASRSHFSSFGGSTSTETSEYSRRSNSNPYPPTSSHHHPPHQQQLKSHPENLNYLRMSHNQSVPQHYNNNMYKSPRINRNDNF